MAGAKERLEVAAFSWNLVGNLVVVYWLYEGIVKPVTTWFEMSCDDCEVHAEDYRRGATGYRVPIRRDPRDVASCCMTKPNAPGRRTKEAGVKMRSSLNSSAHLQTKQFCRFRVPHCGSKRRILFHGWQSQLCPGPYCTRAGRLEGHTTHFCRTQIRNE